MAVYFTFKYIKSNQIANALTTFQSFIATCHLLRREQCTHRPRHSLRKFHGTASVGVSASSAGPRSPAAPVHVYSSGLRDIQSGGLQAETHCHNDHAGRVPEDQRDDGMGPRYPHSTFTGVLLGLSRKHVILPKCLHLLNLSSP